MTSRNYLYRGVSEAFHKQNEGVLKPKVAAPFTYAFHWGESGATWGGITWDSSVHNAVVRHQVNQEGFPTSGISTTPHFERAKFYAHGREGKSAGFVYRIDRDRLSAFGVLEFVVGKYCAPSVPQDDEVILVVGQGEPLPPGLLVEIIAVNPLAPAGQRVPPLNR